MAITHPANKMAAKKRLLLPLILQEGVSSGEASILRWARQEISQHSPGNISQPSTLVSRQTAFSYILTAAAEVAETSRLKQTEI
jgi:hypothetical protein